jgi:hypothetical protein
MITYEQARDLVRKSFEPEWSDGSFYLDDRTVLENDELYVFRIGPRELLVDGDISYARFGGGVPAVVKANGNLVVIPEVRMIELAGSLRIRSNS